MNCWPSSWRFEERLASGADPDDLDAPSVCSDPRLVAEWEADRQCVELMYRVRRTWSPEDAEGDTPRPAAESVTSPVGELGKTLGRFRILHELGHGGLGIVYLAIDPKLRRQVAVKIPRIESLVSDELRRRFLREAEAAARLCHPNIVAVHETGEVNSLCYIAAEFCPGPTLAQWLKSQCKPVAVKVAARIVKQLAEAMQHAHGRGVLHRDIKPSNVLLSRLKAEQEIPGSQGAQFAGPKEDELIRPDDSVAGMCPKLTDFGMAKLLERDGEETRSGALVGTPAYMAPEQAQGCVRNIDARADVYALGAILYELLTGRRVFETQSDMEALRHVLFEEPVAPRKLRAEIPRNLEAITLKCLAKQREARYATAQELADDLNRFLAGRATEARPLGAVERSWKWARRRPTIAALWAVITTATVMLFGTVIGYNSRLSDEVVRDRALGGRPA